MSEDEQRAAVFTGLSSAAGGVGVGRAVNAAERGVAGFADRLGMAGGKRLALRGAARTERTAASELTPKQVKLREAANSSASKARSAAAGKRGSVISQANRARKAAPPKPRIKPKTSQ